MAPAFSARPSFGPAFGDAGATTSTSMAPVFSAFLRFLMASAASPTKATPAPHATPTTDARVIIAAGGSGDFDHDSLLRHRADAKCIERRVIERDTTGCDQLGFQIGLERRRGRARELRVRPCRHLVRNCLCRHENGDIKLYPRRGKPPARGRIHNARNGNVAR